MLKGDEHLLLQEECKEDQGHNGTLTLTDKNITFESQTGHFSSKTRQTEFSVELKSVKNVWTEGNKLAIEISPPRVNPNTPETIQKRKFHVKQPGEWETKIKSASQKDAAGPRPVSTTVTTTTTKYETDDNKESK